MAKLVGLSGTGRGRVGNFVLTKGDNGETIARSYQPQVFNPRTSAQLTQRAKINQAGRLSAIVPKMLLQSMNMGSGRKNRSAFLSNLIAHTSVVVSGNEYAASIDPANIQFGRGAQPLAATAATIVVNASSLRVPLTLNNADLANKYGERIIVLLANAENANDYVWADAVDVVLTSTAQQSVELTFPRPLTAGMYVAVYRTPFVLTDDAAAIVTSNVYGSASELMSGITTIVTNIKTWGRSANQYYAPFTQA